MYDYNCTSLNASSTVCLTYQATSSPYTATSSIISYHDWLFVNSVIILCLIFIPLGLVFNSFSSKRR